MPAKLTIQKIDPPGPPFTVDFNPEEYTLQKDNNFAAQPIPGLSAPLLQYVHGNLRTLEMELLFDTYDTPSAAKVDVRTKTSLLTDLLKIESDTHTPALLLVSWGSLVLTCVLAKAVQRFTLFMPDGVPVRARVTATFHEYADPERQAKADNKQTADFTKVHAVAAGETLEAIAALHYGDAALWRPIAIANRLDDVRALASRAWLAVPALPYRDPQTGDTVA